MNVPTLDPASQQFLADLTRIRDATATAQRRLTSGLRVQRASDGPEQVADILHLRSNIDATEQTIQDLGITAGKVDAAEGALRSAVEAIQRALALAVKGANGTYSESQRRSMAEEASGILQQLVAVSRIQADGQFLFSGDVSSQPYYALDLGSPGGVRQLLTCDSTGLIRDSSGEAFRGGRTAREIFGDASAGVFSAVNDLRVALEGNSAAGVAAALEALRSADDHLNSQLSYYGALQNRLSAAVDHARQLQLTHKAELSRLRDADLTQAALELNAGVSQESAALAAKAKVASRSLFDYLG